MRKRKTLLCIALSLIMVVSAVYVAYQQPKQVKAAVVIDDAMAIAALLAACGLVYVGATTDENWLTDIGELSNGFSLIWDQATDNVILQGTYNWNPDDFNSDDDDPNEKPPRWQQLIDWIKSNPGRVVAGAGTTLAAVLLAFANLLKDDVEEGAFFSDDSIANDTYKEFIIDNLNDYSCYVACYTASTGIPQSITFGSSGEVKYNSNAGRDVVYIYGPGISYSYLLDGSVSGTTELKTSSNKMSFNTSYGNLHTEFFLGSYLGTLNPSSVKYGSQVQTDENGDITALPVPSINVQNFADTFEENYTELGTALEEEDETRTQTAVDTIIESVGKTETETDPDTGTDTDPDTGTTPGTGTDTDTNTGTGSDMTVEDAQQNLDKNQFLLPDTITEKFPFCVPFDIIRAFQLFNSDTRTAPKVKLPLKSASYGIDEELVIDLSEFDEVAELLRTLELIGFIVALALVSRDLIKG